MDSIRNFLNYLQEASKTPKTGTSLRKEQKTSTATNAKARDAARKRAERASQPKKEQLPPAELIKQIVAVETGEGSTELIYKDSYNPNFHKVLNPEKPLSFEDAQAITKEQGFVQTQASQQLFGDLKKKEAAAQRKRVKDEMSSAAQDGEKAEAGPEAETPKAPKPKKMSMEDLLASMNTVDPIALGSIPFDLRQQHFMNNRDPMSDKDFDNLTYETIANQFGIANVDLPFNEQVKNALIMMSRVKAGASDSELSFVTNIKNGLFTQFGREAFEQAKKMLSQIGDECLQIMVSASEAGISGVSAEGKTDFKCGGVNFAVNAQGEISLSTNDMTQQSKSVRKTIQKTLMKTIQDPSMMQKDPVFAQTINGIGELLAGTPTALISDSTFEQLSKDPMMYGFMQSEPVISADGRNLGPMIMPTGELNPAISFKAFEDSMDRTINKFVSQEKSTKGPFLRELIKGTVQTHLRGDEMGDPEVTANHLATMNGIFPMTDDYFTAISGNGDISVSKTDKVFGTKKDDISKYRVVVEQKQAELQDPNIAMRELLYSMMTPLQGSALDLFANTLIKNYNFDMNVSLLPGVKPKDIHGVEYNKIKVHGKTFKIPVVRDQELVADSLEEAYLTANNVLLESLENDDVLKALYDTNLLGFEDAENIVAARYEGLELHKDSIVSVLKNLTENIQSNPNIMIECIQNLQEAKKRKRNYKREYKLFHGKPDQIKKRSKRVKARREAEKKGLVHKGDNKDIDHKVPLRKGGGNGKGNLRVRDRSANRSDNGKYKGQPADKPRTDK